MSQRPGAKKLAALKKEAEHRYAEFKDLLGRTLVAAACWGETLVALKAAMRHGEWQAYVRQTFHCSPDTAERYMLLARHWPELEAEFKDDPRASVNKALKYLARLRDRKTDQPVTQTAELLRILNAVSPALDQSSGSGTPEDTAVFSFRDGLVYTKNADLACQHPCRHVWPGHELLISAEPLLSLLKNSADKELRISVDESTGNLILEGEKDRAELVSFQEPPDPRLPLPDTWKPLPDEFEQALTRTLAYIEPNDLRFALKCVHFSPEFLEATNNCQMFRYILPSSFPDGHSPTAALQHLSGTHVREYGETADNDRGHSWLHFRNDAGLVLSCAFYREGYPDLDQILEAQGIPITWPTGLVRAVERARVFLKGVDTDNSVQVQLRASELTLASAGSLGSYAEMLPVPDYDGPELSFRIDPSRFAHSVRHYPNCEIIHNEKGCRIKATGDYFDYVCCASLDPKSEF